MIPRSAGWSRAALVAVLYLGLAAAGLTWSALRGDANVWRLRTAPEPRFWGGLLGGFALGLAIVVVSRVVVRRFAWARALHQEFRALLSPLTDLEIVALALASSVGEEIFFRGALMPTVGIWLSSAVFALLHIGPRRQYLPWTVGAFGAGLLFSQLYVWSGDLTGPVAAHFTVNFLNLRHVARHDFR